jgi:hypothetical protein
LGKIPFPRTMEGPVTLNLEVSRTANPSIENLTSSRV